VVIIALKEQGKALAFDLLMGSWPQGYGLNGCIYEHQTSHSEQEIKTNLWNLTILMLQHRSYTDTEFTNTADTDAFCTNNKARIVFYLQTSLP
jgi:hypothetical protein